MSKPPPAAGCLQQIVALAVFGLVALAGVEVWLDRFAWPVADNWYRLEVANGRVRFGCQNFAPVEFAETPAPGVARILLLGGSTTFGFPERPVGDAPIGRIAHGFAGALQAALDASWPGRFELVDLGVNGGKSEDTLRLVRRATGWGAAGVIVYDGHNEMMSVPTRFVAGLWRFALYRRLSVLSTKANTSPGWVGPAAYGDADHARAVRDGLRRNLEAVIDAADGLPVVLATQAANLSGFDPSWSTEGDPDVLASLWTLSDAEVEARFAAAPGVADLAWAAGRRRLATGGDARAALRAAADADGMPFRATTAVNDVIRDVASERGAVLVDAEAAVRGAGDLPDEALFYDWVHPRPVAAERIAAALLDGMGRAGLLPAGARAAPVHAPLTPAEEAEADVRVAASWVQWACVRGHDPAFRLAGARAWAEQALAVAPGHREATALVEIARALGGEDVAWRSDADTRARMARIHPCVAARLAR